MVGLGAWVLGRGKESTDDAQVEGRIVSVSPRVSGQVSRVAVIDNQAVKQGDLLVEIDPKDLDAKLALAARRPRVGPRRRGLGRGQPPAHPGQQRRRAPAGPRQPDPGRLVGAGHPERRRPVARRGRVGAGRLPPRPARSRAGRRRWPRPTPSPGPTSTPARPASTRPARRSPRRRPARPPPRPTWSPPAAESPPPRAASPRPRPRPSR